MQTVRLDSRLWRHPLAGGAVLFTLESESLSIAPERMAAALQSPLYRPAPEPATRILARAGIQTPRQPRASAVGRCVRVTAVAG
jgi:hypothetical protein